MISVEVNNDLNENENGVMDDVVKLTDGGGGGGGG